MMKIYQLSTMVSESGRFVEVVSDNTHASWVRALGGGRP